MSVIIGAAAVLVAVILLIFLIRQREKHLKASRMYKYAEYLKEKQLQDSQHQIKNKDEKISLLEKELDRMNNIHSLGKYNNKEMIIMSSDVYHRFIDYGEYGSDKRPKQLDWEELEQVLSVELEGFPMKLRALCKLSKRDYRMCLLLRIGIPPQKIARILSIEKSTVSTQRARLYRDYFGRKGSAKDWDAFVCSL